MRREFGKRGCAESVGRGDAQRAWEEGMLHAFEERKMSESTVKISCLLKC